MQRIPGNSQQPSINPNHRRLQLVASQPINLCRTLPIIDREPNLSHCSKFWGISLLLEILFEIATLLILLKKNIHHDGSVFWTAFNPVTILWITEYL